VAHVILLYPESQAVLCTCEICDQASLRDTVLWLSVLYTIGWIHWYYHLLSSFLLYSHSRIPIPGHMIDVPSALTRMIFVFLRKERWFLYLIHYNSKNCLSEAMVVECIHYHPEKSFCILSYKGIKEIGLDITGNWANSPGERTQPIHRSIQLNPVYSFELGTADIKMDMTCLLRGLQSEGRDRLLNN
jgi:hypothetical protein